MCLFKSGSRELENAKRLKRGSFEQKVVFTRNNIGKKNVPRLRKEIRTEGMRGVGNRSLGLRMK